MQLSLADGLFLRRKIHLAEEDARAARPACSLATSWDVDDDGFVYVHFTCLTHGTTWREICAVVSADAVRGPQGIPIDRMVAARAGACAGEK